MKKVLLSEILLALASPDSSKVLQEVSDRYLCVDKLELEEMEEALAMIYYYYRHPARGDYRDRDRAMERVGKILHPKGAPRAVALPE